LKKFINENPYITQVELSRKLGITERAVIKIIKKLQNNKELTRIGSRKTGYWKTLI